MHLDVPMWLFRRAPLMLGPHGGAGSFWHGVHCSRQLFDQRYHGLRSRGQ